MCSTEMWRGVNVGGCMSCNSQGGAALNWRDEISAAGKTGAKYMRATAIVGASYACSTFQF